MKTTAETSRSAGPLPVMLDCVFDLAGLGPEQHPLVGAKAAGLGRMMQAGLPVPPGFCITSAAYRRHLEEHDVFTKIEAMLAKDRAGKLTVTTKRSALTRLRRAIAGAPVDEALAAEIARRLAALGDGEVAVRSSATAEDLPGHSFAGQHGTYFVSGADACLEHIKHCWASLWTERAFDYRSTHGFYHTSVEMAVVVQSLVAADAAGVLFTADPISGRTDRLLLEACFGLGEALVTGKVTPDTMRLSRENLEVLDSSIGNKPFEIRPGLDGDGVELATDPSHVAASAVDERTARRVARLGLKAEELLGSPLDIEWAVANGRTYLLQARPITTLPVEQADRTVWSNANAGEVLPDVARPMTKSLTLPLVGAIFDTIFGHIGLELGDYRLATFIAGRAYFNVNVLAGAVRSMPNFAKMDLTEILGGMQGHHSNSVRITIADEDMPDLHYGVRRLLLHVPSFTLWCARHTPSHAQALIDEIRRRTEEAADIDPAAATEDEIATRLSTLSAGLWSLPDAIGFALVSFMYYSNLSALCRRWLGDRDGSTTNRLLTGLGGMASADAGLALWRLAVLAHDCRGVRDAIGSGASFDDMSASVRRLAGGRAFLDAWQEFMRDHGHHTRGELDVANARWSEDPAYVLEIIRGYLSDFGSVDATALHKQRAADREALTAQCRAKLPSALKRAIFNHVLRRAQDGSTARENVKNEGVRYMAALRSLLLALGGHLTTRGVLSQADDIFFLYLPEVDPVRLGTAEFDVAETIAARRAEYERDRKLSPPPVIVGSYDPRTSHAEAIPATDVLEGLGVSAGVATGPARVVLRADDDAQVQPGEILVAPFTDPGWTPYFIPAAGIVMDMGGMLSHGSICAREYGIPAVVNVGPATKLITTGQMVLVDGTKGEVKVLDASS